MRKFKNQHGITYTFYGDEPLNWLVSQLSRTKSDNSIIEYGFFKLNDPNYHSRKVQPGFWDVVRKLGYFEVENKYTENSIRTYTGKVFDLRIMDMDSICIEDIAHALAHTSRFGGHLKKHYSVAQHCVVGAMELEPEHQLAFLLHDATEAYIGDMPSPFKKLMPEFKQIEDKLMAVIAEKFGIKYPFEQQIKEMDIYMLNREWNSFVLEENSTLEYWTAEESKSRFLDFFYSLIMEPTF